MIAPICLPDVWAEWDKIMAGKLETNKSYLKSFVSPLLQTWVEPNITPEETKKYKTCIKTRLSNWHTQTFSKIKE